MKINDANDSGCIFDWIAGPQWVNDNLSKLSVKVVNMSICTTTLYGVGGSCDSSQAAFSSIVSKLVAAGLTIFASSGNDGSSTQLSAPACLARVIGVGATYKSNQGRQSPSGSYSQWGGFGNCTDASTAFDQVTCFTNSNSRLDIVAPGAVIESDHNGATSALSVYRGTSQASPAAAGVAALMLECDPKLTPAQVKNLLISTASAVKDPKNGLSFPSIRADLAVKAACASAGGAMSSMTLGSGAATGTGGAISQGGAIDGGAPSTGTSSPVGTPTFDSGEEDAGCSCRIAEGPSGYGSMAFPRLAMPLSVFLRRKPGSSHLSALVGR